MHFIKFVFLLIIGAAMANEGFQYTVKNLGGACPKISFINNFSMPPMMGWWYLTNTTVASSECYNNQGRTMYAAQYDNSTILAQMCCQSASTPNIAACGDNIGSGTAKPTSTPGEFIYQFAKQFYTVYVLDTNYKDHALIYGCKTIGSGNRLERDELIYDLRREYKCNDALDKRIHNVLVKNGAQLSKLKGVKQGPSIPYTPGNKPCGSEQGGCGCAH